MKALQCRVLSLAVATIYYRFDDSSNRVFVLILEAVRSTAGSKSYGLVLGASVPLSSH